MEAEKRVKPIEEGQDQSLIKEQTKAATEAIAEQTRLAKEAALLKREAEKAAWNKKTERAGDITETKGRRTNSYKTDSTSSSSKIKS